MIEQMPTHMSIAASRYIPQARRLMPTLASQIESNHGDGTLYVSFCHLSFSIE